MSTTIYPWRVKIGSYEIMSKVLKSYFFETVDSKMDGKICRITVTSYKIEANIKPEYQRELSKDHIYQIKVLGIDDREFLILQSLLEDLDDETVYINENGNRLYENWAF